MRPHIEWMHNKKDQDKIIHQCVNCKNNVNTNIQLYQHVSTHTECLCLLCGNQFADKGEVNTHVKSIHLRKKVKIGKNLGIFKET